MSNCFWTWPLGQMTWIASMNVVSPSPNSKGRSPKDPRPAPPLTSLTWVLPPAVTLTNVRDVSPAPAGVLAFELTVPANAVPGPRSLVFVTDGGQVSTLTGFLDVAGPTDEQACANAFDDDGDGFTDCEDSDCEAEEVCTDQCPADPFKTEPGVCGCGVPDDDDDGDGTLNCLDDCPADPNKTAPGACGCGVSDEDLDGDGVADCCTAGDTGSAQNVAAFSRDMS